jgi:Photosynthesis system II assembly factor YCF48
VSSAAPAPGLDSNSPLAKAAAPHATFAPRMAPQTIARATGSANAYRAPAGSVHAAAGGVAGGVPAGALGGVLGGVIGGTGAIAPQQSSQSVTITAEVAIIQPQWSLSEDGIPQRSDDSGHTWRKVAVDGRVQFRTLYADQQEIWVGGPAGVLYHSSDMGAHWTRVRPTDGAATLSADIARIDFKDPLHGDVTTARGGIWTTADGGVSWLRH